MAALTLGAFLQLAALAAAAEPTEGSPALELRQQVDRALTHYANGELEASRQLLLQARGQAHDPKLLGIIELYLGLNAAAEDNLGEADRRFALALAQDSGLRLDPDQFKPEVVQLLEQVRRRVLARIEVSAEPAGALLFVDGKPAGSVPLSAWLQPGPHRLELRRQGRVLHREEVQLHGGQTHQLKLLGGASPPASAPASQPERKEPPRRRLWTWVLGAGAIAAVASAIGLGASSWKDQDQACALLLDNGQPCSDRRRLADPVKRARYDELYDSVSQKSLAANVLWGTAGALAVGAAILFWLEGRPTDRQEKQPRLQASRSGFSLQLRY